LTLLLVLLRLRASGLGVLRARAAGGGTIHMRRRVCTRERQTTREQWRGE
jgi:hypothetical protein